MRRRMTGADLDIIEKIIRDFKGKPEWALITERAKGKGLPFSQITLTRNKNIIAMKKEKEKEFRKKRTQARGLPQNDPSIATKLENLKKENEELKETVRQYAEYVRGFKSNADKLGIKQEDLDLQLPPKPRIN